MPESLYRLRVLPVPEPLNQLRVLIVARDQLVRAGLAALLAPQPGSLVVGQVGPSEDLGSALQVYQPEVLLWDLGWDADTALALLSDLPDNAPPVVALLADHSQTADAQSAGAKALLLRDADVSTILAAMQAAAQGLVVFDPSLPASAPARSPIGDAAPGLTPRELEALLLLAEGLPNKAIAGRLGISEHTVKFHVNSILGKLGAQSRTEAVTRATRLGLILL